MNAWERLQLAFKQYRKELNDGTSPTEGLWSKTNRTRLLSLVLVHGTFFCVLLAQGRLESLWVFTVGFLAGYSAMVPGALLTKVLPHKFGQAISGISFFKWAIGATAIGIPLGHAVFIGLNALHPIKNIPDLMQFMPEYAVVMVIAYSSWRYLYVRQWQYKLDTEKLKREAAEHGQALAQAQLKMLQAQIEPHFLFNTLASIQHLVRKDAQLADYLLSQLISYLRQAVPDIRGVGSTLGREFGLIESYLNIAKIRMGGRLEVEVSIPLALADVSFPVLIIHTLVENAIKHGVEPKPGAVKITVMAAEASNDEQSIIEISVIDNGVGFGGANTKGTGVGLSNIRERLAGIYGDSARLTISNVAPSGVCATVRFPNAER